MVKCILKSPGKISTIAMLMFCFAFTSAFCQKEYNVWYFGNLAGITFNTTPPTALTNSPMYTSEGSSGICDDSGNLLFYTDGDTVFNRLHLPMKNGVFIPFSNRESSKQAAMVLPYPNQPGKYYIITTSSFEGRSTDGYMRYSVVDMTKDGGLGELVIQNVQLVEWPLETFAVGQHSNGNDYWLAAINYNDSFLYTVPTVNGNMAAPVKGPKVLSGRLQYTGMKFSPNSAILKLPGSFTGPLANTECYYNLCRFNTTTGTIYDTIKVHVPNQGAGYAFEFSPNSRFLYVEEQFSLPAPGRKEIVQYDLSVWHSDSIANSRVVLESSSTSDRYIFGMQLGPDGKIYFFNYNYSKLECIDNPDLKGKACGFGNMEISLAGRFLVIGCPYYPSFWFRTLQVHLPPDTVLCTGDSVTIKATSDAKKFMWCTGDTTQSITVNTGGVYWVKGIINGDTAVDSITVTYKKPFTVYLGSDTAFCGKFAHLLNAGKDHKSYLWNTGDTTITKLVDKPGIYAVTVKDSSNCQSGDTINIDQLNAPPVKINYDSITCSYVLLSVTPQNGIKYLWASGDTTNSIKVTQKGAYKLTASNLFCNISSTINADKLATPEIELGADTVLCGNTVELVAGDSGNYLWNTGEIKPIITVNTAGWYKVAVTRNHCTATDSVYVSDGCSFWYYIPNAFTPGKDGLNNVFGVTGEFVSARILLFTRWGELMFDEEGPNPTWDGTYKNTPCQQDTYTYMVEVTGKRKGRLVKENVAGTVTLLR